MISRYPKVVAKNKEENYRSTVDAIFSVPVLSKYTETLGQNPKERNSRTQVKREILNMGFLRDNQSSPVWKYGFK